MSGRRGGGLRVYVFDDRVADGWAPFALTRPCGELRFGRWTLRERLESVVGVPAAGHLSRPWLARYAEHDGVPCVGPDHLPHDGRCLVWSSRAVPAGAGIDPEPANLWVGDALAGVLLAPEHPRPDAAWLADPAPFPELPDRRVEGTWLSRAWDLVARGPDQLARDLSASTALPPGEGVPAGAWKLGSGPVRVAPSARVEPGVLFDVREGGIEIGPEVEVRTGTRLAGPLYAGPGSRLLGGAISGFAGGPMSYVRGEVEQVTMLGYANKAHDGFLGHAYVGRWVNLGALTTNSDLKNNYGSVRVGPPGEEVDTGLYKLGCLIGDHAKTGIGVLLNTGTIVGAGSNLFGAELPPKWIAPFSWGRGAALEVYRRDAFLATAAKVVARRGVEASDALSAWLGDAWDAARGTS